MANNFAQDLLFQYIRERLPQSDSLADVVSGILHISADSAYRRIRGETPLVLEEAKLLCDHFQLSLDQLLNSKKSSTVFQTIRINKDEDAFENYLTEILSNLKIISQHPNSEIIYLTKDIPIFDNFVSPVQFAFRYYFWMRSIVQHPAFSNQGFSPGCLTPKVIALGTELLKLYNSVSSTEIWNTECINSAIFQIEYCREAGLFSSGSDIKQVYESLEETIEHLRLQAEYGAKFSKGENPEVKKNNLKLFYNRIVLGDNTILVLTGESKSLYLNYDVLNYMNTTDRNFCDETHNVLQNLMRRSTLISNTSEKQRNIFFNILMAKLRDRKSNL